ncbi:MAG: hypothetical protein EOP45_06275 [Sphingobacteriaceae bacterium]|nr:MAG: hypothetical protein EOP45_06275 [Sphingobacteriaceae bacterium]
MQSPNTSQEEKWYTRLREAIWPLLDPEFPETVFPNEPIVIEDDNLDQAFQLITKFAEGEEERRKTVESKSTLLLSTISLATTLIVASNTLLSTNTEKSWPVICSVGISFLLCLYTTMTVRYAVKSLERGSYNFLSFKDINQEGDKNTYKRHLILSTWKKTRSNFKTINNKVDYMNLAQSYYQRAIVIIGLYALLIFLFCLFYKPVVVKPITYKATSLNVLKR